MEEKVNISRGKARLQWEPTERLPEGKATLRRIQSGTPLWDYTVRNTLSASKAASSRSVQRLRAEAKQGLAPASFENAVKPRSGDRRAYKGWWVGVETPIGVDSFQKEAPPRQRKG
jgi:hypothetical protein